MPSDIDVQISHMKGADTFLKEQIEQVIGEFVQKASRLYKGTESLQIDVKRHEKQGKKIKYSVHSHMQTPVGYFSAEAHGWNDLISVVQDSLSKLEMEVKKKHEKIVMKKRG
ncbi:MAG: hypothetical protein ABIG30_00610 [Candidatus Aenigmatarchaeota archaeon]